MLICLHYPFIAFSIAFGTNIPSRHPPKQTNKHHPIRFSVQKAIHSVPGPYSIFRPEVHLKREKKKNVLPFLTQAYKQSFLKGESWS